MTGDPGNALARDPFAHDDGVYVLGALSDNERAAFEAHLDSCGECRARVADVQPLRVQLGAVAAHDVADLADSLFRDPPVWDASPADEWSDAPVPDTLLPGLLRRAGAERRRQRRLATGLVGLAAACVALLVALVVALQPSSPSSAGRAPARALTALVPAPVRAEATLVAKPWGTEIDLRCSYSAHVPRGVPYLLQIRDWHGHTERLGTWTLPAGKPVTFSAGTALRPSQISQVEVALVNGRPILRVTY